MRCPDFHRLPGCSPIVSSSLCNQVLAAILLRCRAAGRLRLSLCVVRARGALCIGPPIVGRHRVNALVASSPDGQKVSHSRVLVGPPIDGDRHDVLDRAAAAGPRATERMCWAIPAGLKDEQCSARLDIRLSSAGQNLARQFAMVGEVDRGLSRHRVGRRDAKAGGWTNCLAMFVRVTSCQAAASLLVRLF